MQSAFSHVFSLDLILIVSIGGKKEQHPNSHLIDKEVKSQHDGNLTKIIELVHSRTQL